MASILLNRHRLRAPELFIPRRAPIGPTVLNRRHPSAKGLIGWWLLNEGKGQVARNLAAKGSDGALSNIEAEDWVRGWTGSGYALNFDGVDKSVNAGNYTMPEAAGAVSLFFNVVNKDVASNPLLTLRNSSPLQLFDIVISGAGTDLLYTGWYDNGDEDRIQISTTNITDDTWHNLVFNWVAGGTSEVFIDNVSKGTLTPTNATWDTSAVNLVLAKEEFSSTYYAGGLADVRIYNGILTRNRRDRLIRYPYEILQPPGPEYLAFSTGAGATILSIADLAHAHALDNVALTQAQLLSIADSTHAHTLDNVALTQAQVLAIAGALHAHGLDAMTLQAGDTLIIAGLDHSHTLDPANLVQAQVLAIADVLHGHTLDGMTLDLGEVTLVISDLIHAHLLDACNVYPLDSVDTPAGRVFLIEHESRIFAVAAESRIFTVQ